jgi:hypothetical protein
VLINFSFSQPKEKEKKERKGRLKACHQYHTLQIHNGGYVLCPYSSTNTARMTMWHVQSSIMRGATASCSDYFYIYLLGLYTFIFFIIAFDLFFYMFTTLDFLFFHLSLFFFARQFK